MNKRKILVLAPYTNGHEAALQFIRRQGWKKKECEIVFCGSHDKLLQRLAEGQAYGVVPVHNSTKGEITSVTGQIKSLKEFGYDFKVHDSFGLRIRHCLMAPRHVQDINDLSRVLSKGEAMSQCDAWLKTHHLAVGKRSSVDSTGAAALHVSKIVKGSKHNIGAIAPKSAAKAYGLKILAEDIQDDPKNKTTFHLLYNAAVPEKGTVGIIGINGKFGQVLKSFFEGLGLDVIGSDKKKPTEFTNIEVVKKADVVIFSVSVRRTVTAIREVIKYVRKGQLLMDVTSVKQPAVNAMLKGKGQVVGLHPMFAPGVSFEGQTIVVCPARLTDPSWKTWVVNMLAASGAKRKWSDAAAHDRYMVTVQVGPQSSNLVNALVVTETGVSVAESLAFTSPFYRLMFSLMGRLLTQDPELYASIFMQNPETLGMLRKRIEIEKRLMLIIQRKDYAALAEWFKKAQNHFGSSVIAEANEMFMRFNAVTRTLEGKNSIVLEFKTTANRPGLLERVAAVFRRKGVNLTGFNFVSFGPDRNQFSLTTEQPNDSEGVIGAIRIIEGWKSYKIIRVA